MTRTPEDRREGLIEQIRRDTAVLEGPQTYCPDRRFYEERIARVREDALRLSEDLKPIEQPRTKLGYQIQKALPPCAYCGHQMNAHSEPYQGAWRCRHRGGCVCVAYKASVEPGAKPLPADPFEGFRD